MRLRHLKKLGGGASAEVYLATSSAEHGFERQVAVKRLRQELLDDPEQVEAFVSEAKLLSQLQHPNIATVLDFGVEDDAPYQVLEYVNGPSVQSIFQLLSDGRLQEVPETIALHIVNEVANALDYVHRAKSATGEPLEIVHRDINPTNILISQTGDIKLTDFGNSTALPRARNTGVGIVRGTVAYMAPEQLRFEEADARSDLYALGLVLHALLRGAPPSEDGAGLVPAAIPELADDLAVIIDRATQPNPVDRYPRAWDMSADCWRALSLRLERDARQTMARWLQRSAGPITAEFERSILASNILRERDDAPTAIEIPAQRRSPRPKTQRLDPGALFAMGAASEEPELLPTSPMTDHAKTNAAITDSEDTALKPNLQPLDPQLVAPAPPISPPKKGLWLALFLGAGALAVAASAAATYLWRASSSAVIKVEAVPRASYQAVPRPSARPQTPPRPTKRARSAAPRRARPSVEAVEAVETVETVETVDPKGSARPKMLTLKSRLDQLHARLQRLPADRPGAEALEARYLKLRLRWRPNLSPQNRRALLLRIEKLEAGFMALERGER